MSNPVLKVKGLKVAYGGIQAVKGIDLDVQEGELVCLIGANGAGKTSALRAICGLHARGGRVRYAGEPLDKYLVPGKQPIELVDDRL